MAILAVCSRGLSGVTKDPPRASRRNPLSWHFILGGTRARSFSFKATVAQCFLCTSWVEGTVSARPDTATTIWLITTSAQRRLCARVQKNAVAGSRIHGIILRSDSHVGSAAACLQFTRFYASASVPTFRLLTSTGAAPFGPQAGRASKSKVRGSLKSARKSQSFRREVSFLLSLLTSSSWVSRPRSILHPRILFVIV